MTTRSIALTAILALGIALCSTHTLRADDAAPAQAATGTIKGKVIGSDGKPANSVNVRLVAAEPGKAKPGKKGKGAADPAAQPPQAQTFAAKGAKAAKAAAKPSKRAPALKETTTNDQGEFTFTDVPVGNYAIMAGGKTVGTGRAPAAVTAGNSATVSLTLKAPKNKTPKAAGKAPRPEPAAGEPAAPAR
jgi:hypothetical protein